MKCKCNMCQGTGKTKIVETGLYAPCEKCDGWRYMIVSDDALKRQNEQCDVVYTEGVKE